MLNRTVPKIVSNQVCYHLDLLENNFPLGHICLFPFAQQWDHAVWCYRIGESKENSNLGVPVFAKTA